MKLVKLSKTYQIKKHGINLYIILILLALLIFVIIYDNIVTIDWTKEIDYIESKQYNDELYTCPYCSTEMESSNIIDLTKDPPIICNKCPKCNRVVFK